MGEGGRRAIFGSGYLGDVVSKVETVYQLEKIDELLSLNGRSDLTRWIMIETPRGVLDLETLADHSLR